MNLKTLHEKYMDVIPYLFFGVCTTLVNVIVYWIAAYLLHLAVMPSTILAWIFAVLFAYITNRKWVFLSQVKDIKKIFRETLLFFICRMITGIIDWTCMFLFVNLLHYNDVFIKFLANVIVIILNYMASKLIIFKRRDAEHGK